MQKDWTADITNDPRSEYDLCIELSYRGGHKLTVRRSSDGTLVLDTFNQAGELEIPAAWLAAIIHRAEDELPPPKSLGGENNE